MFRTITVHPFQRILLRPSSVSRILVDISSCPTTWIYIVTKSDKMRRNKQVSILTRMMYSLRMCKLTINSYRSVRRQPYQLIGRRSSEFTCFDRYRSCLKYPRYRPTWPRRVQEVKAPRFLNTLHTKVVRSSPLRTGRLYPQDYPGTHFQRLNRPRAHGLVGCFGKRRLSLIIK